MTEHKCDVLEVFIGNWVSWVARCRVCSWSSSDPSEAGASKWAGYHFATARAAAEADSLRARLDKLQAFKDYVHQRLDAAGVPANPEADKNAEHGCRIEGRLNFVEATAASLRAQLEEARARVTRMHSAIKIAKTIGAAEQDGDALALHAREYRAGLQAQIDALIGDPIPSFTCPECGKPHPHAESDHAHALTTAQGEVATLRSALMSSGGSCGTCVKSSLSSRTCERGTNGCDVRHWQTDEAKAALASTRATAAAHDERVRREALGSLRRSVESLFSTPCAEQAFFAGVERALGKIDFHMETGGPPTTPVDALAHPTKEPSK